MSFFQKHPRRTIAVVFFVLLLFLIGLTEIILRVTVPYDMGFYAAVAKTGKYEYSYGTIYMNSDGYPDTEFNRQSNKKRIGYFGDSVTYGIGVGSGYRYSDMLEQQYPAFEHWTFSMIASGIEEDRMLKAAETFKLNTVIYAMNLNDILPEIEQTENKGVNLPAAEQFVRDYLDTLRGQSYLYTWLRTQAKLAAQKMGYGHTGFKAAELMPDDHREMIKQTADRINALSQKLMAQNIKFCVMILPYEMQISDNAAQTYKKLGITWQDGFENGRTQTYLKNDLNVKHLFDATDAFAGLKHTAKVGEYFIFNKGDSLDFNHPNRAGHKLIADGMAKNHFCGF